MSNTKEIKIQVPDGYEIDKERSTFERIVFKEKDGLNYESICNSLFKDKDVYYTDNTGEICQTTIDEHNLQELNNSVTEEQLESILALNKLCNVAKYLNGTWLPDFLDSDQPKYYLYLNKDIIRIDSFFTLKHSCVYFKSGELAEKALEILGEDEIRKALTLNH